MNDFENNASNGSAESSLHEVAWAGDLAWVRIIVEEGVDVNWKDSCGETAIFKTGVRTQYLIILERIGI